MNGRVRMDLPLTVPDGWQASWAGVGEPVIYEEMFDTLDKATQQRTVEWMRALLGEKVIISEPAPNTIRVEFANMVMGFMGLITEFVGQLEARGEQELGASIQIAEVLRRASHSLGGMTVASFPVTPCPACRYFKVSYLQNEQGTFELSVCAVAPAVPKVIDPEAHKGCPLHCESGDTVPTGGRDLMLLALNVLFYKLPDRRYVRAKDKDVARDRIAGYWVAELMGKNIMVKWDSESGEFK